MSAAALLTGCVGTPSAIADIRYDFGPALPAASTGGMPAVKVLDVAAPAQLESDKLIYRPHFVDAQRMASYANAHWTMTPRNC